VIKATRLETVIIELHIDIKMAELLKAMMQNAHPNEPSHITPVRQALFEALHSAGVKS
jgi:hypothetical protein